MISVQDEIRISWEVLKSVEDFSNTLDLLYKLIEITTEKFRRECKLDGMDGETKKQEAEPDVVSSECSVGLLK